MRKEFTFIGDLDAYNPDGFVVKLDKDIVGKKSLLDEISVKFSFPNYFGHNWDALVDCLCDLSWIKQYNISLIHTMIPCLEKRELLDYIHTLREVMHAWENAREPQHQFDVVFPIPAKRFLRTIESVE